MICLDALASLDAEATDAARLKQSILKAAFKRAAGAARWPGHGGRPASLRRAAKP
jgi:hypothetical protein